MYLPLCFQSHKTFASEYLPPPALLTLYFPQYAVNQWAYFITFGKDCLPCPPLSPCPAPRVCTPKSLRAGVSQSISQKMASVSLHLYLQVASQRSVASFANRLVFAPQIPLIAVNVQRKEKGKVWCAMDQNWPGLHSGILPQIRLRPPTLLSLSLIRNYSGSTR